MPETIIINYPGANEGRKHLHQKGKFIQIVLHGQEYLLFAPSERHRYHNQILACFLKEQKIPHYWLDQETLEVDYPGLTVIGGGRYQLNLENRSLKLWDDSQAYGRFDERGLAEKMAAAGNVWKGLKIIIS